MMIPNSEAVEAPRALSPSSLALLALPLNACCWPVPGPRFWCGKPATRGSYCTDHHGDSLTNIEFR